MSTETQRAELSLDRCANCRHLGFRHQTEDGHCSYEKDMGSPSFQQMICGCKSFVLQSKEKNVKCD